MTSPYTSATERGSTPLAAGAPNGTSHGRHVHCERDLEQYIAAGYALTPVAVDGKHPIFTEWTTRDVPLDELRALFAKQPYNIGGRLGETSGDLVDIDLDSPEALAIVDRFLPSTPAMFGRASKPRSHRLYRAPVTTDTFEDPAPDDGDNGMLVELRSTRTQTVLPGSIHVSGEPITWSDWDGPGIPEAPSVDGSVLRRAVALLAASALLGRHYPSKGSRHEFELGLAGGLLRAGVRQDDVIAVLDAVAVASGFTSDATATAKVLDTKRTLDAGELVTGWPTVIDSLGGDDAAKKIVTRVIKWLAVSSKAIRLSRDDFYAYLPSHKYIFRPTGALWEISGINGNLAAITDGFDVDGNPVRWKPSSWLDTHRPVHQLTWLPGGPEVLENVIVEEAGMIEHAGARAYNTYRAPQPMDGDRSRAGPWLDLIERLYPDERDHLVAWFAQRVQRPDEKINHALVLGGAQGIGKDTILEGVVRAIGPANCGEATPSNIAERFNEYLENVLLRVSEARDLGEANRYGFYERTKPLTASPPETLRIDQKYVGAYRILNLVGVVFTTNNRTTGLYLPPDDRRHFVAWSEIRPEDFDEGFFTRFYQWYEDEGFGHVRAYLEGYDLSSFNPKAPPKKTEAFWAMVDANSSPEEGALGDVLDALGSRESDGSSTRPLAITIGMITDKARVLSTSTGDGIYPDDDVDDYWKLVQTLIDKKTSRRVPHMLEAVNYVGVRSPGTKDGRWVIGKRRQTVYASTELAVRDRIRVAGELAGDEYATRDT